MKNIIIIILVIACVASIILGITGQFKLIDKIDKIESTNVLLTKTYKLTNEILSLSLEYQKLMQEIPQDKKRMHEINIERYKLQQEKVKISKQILLVLDGE